MAQHRAADERQYCQEPAPRLAASRHAGRRPSRAGVITSTIRGIWKYM